MMAFLRKWHLSHFFFNHLNDCKEIQPVHSKGDQSWVLFGRNDAKAETPVLWPPYMKSWLIGKDSDAGRDWGQEEKGMTEDEMAGWHHRLNGREFEWTPGVGDGQGGLACCNSWGHRVGHDWATELNWCPQMDKEEEMERDFMCLLPLSSIGQCLPNGSSGLYLTGQIVEVPRVHRE